LRRNARAASGLGDQRKGGWSHALTSGSNHFFLLGGGNYTNLDFPGASFTSAFALNDLGQIVGTAELSPAGVPGPVVGAGLPGLLMVVAAFILLRRSRRVIAI
jgi:hypothetical protein